VDLIPELLNPRFDVAQGHDFDLITDRLGAGDEFAPGDRVRDKTFGQPMTVADVYPPGYKYRYRCVWTDGNDNQEHELFRAADLTAYMDFIPD
jgi:uncharacterized protein YodC (DUF2158 family)